MNEEITALELANLAAKLVSPDRSAKESVKLAYALYEAAKVELERQEQKENARLHDLAVRAFFEEHGPTIKLADICRPMGFVNKGIPDQQKLERVLKKPFTQGTRTIYLTYENLNSGISVSDLSLLIARFEPLREYGLTLAKKRFDAS